MSLIPISQLQSIRRQVGLKTAEAGFDITRLGAPVASGSGFTKASASTVATVAGRVSFVGSMNVSERQRQGMLQLNASYLLTLEAGCDVQVGDLIKDNPLPWAAGNYYFFNQRSRATANDTSIFQIAAAGTAGVAEPTWQAVGNTVADGGGARAPI